MKICDFDGRDNIYRYKEKLCGGHLAQKSKGKNLVPLRKIRKQGSSSKRNELGEKLCPSCERWLSIDFFGKHLSTPDKLRTNCKKCHSIQKYGLNANTYEKLLDKQNNKCAICDEQLKEKKICIDHDHSCCPKWKSCGKCLRGVLCYSCNTAEGLLKSNPIIIDKLLKYVENGGVNK